MAKCRRPVLRCEARTVQEGTSFDPELIVIDFDRAVLRRTVGTSGLNRISMFPEHSIDERGATSQFAALVGPDTAAIVVAVLRQKSGDDVKRRVFA